MKINISDIKNLREITGAGVSDCREALEYSAGNISKAKDFLAKKGVERAEKRSQRQADLGSVFSYIHGEGRVGVLVKILCETSFVAATDEFKKLGKEIAMQIAALDPKDLPQLLAQDYIRDSSKKISDLVTEISGKTGEKIKIAGFTRYEV